MQGGQTDNWEHRWADNQGIAQVTEAGLDGALFGGRNCRLVSA